jgi:murein DD-endopeptidase MepM/ murein hydrolase activator NlpD
MPKWFKIAVLIVLPFSLAFSVIFALNVTGLLLKAQTIPPAGTRVVPVLSPASKGEGKNLQLRTFGFATITPTPNPTSSAGSPQSPSTMAPAVNCSGAKCAYKYMVPYTSICCRWVPGGHKGVDLILRANIPIRNLEDGVVIKAEYDRGGGNMYKIHDKNKRFHMGLHLIRPSHLKAGQLVKRGDIVGYVGHTGKNTSTIDHLHYQISTPSSDQYNSWANPDKVLAKWPNY